MILDIINPPQSNVVQGLKNKFSRKSFSKMACNYNVKISEEQAFNSNLIENPKMKLEIQANEMDDSIFVLNGSQDEKAVIDLSSDESFPQPATIQLSQQSKKRKRYSLTHAKHEERKTERILFILLKSMIFL